MMDNIYIYGGIVFSQRLLLKLTAIIGDRDKAYRMVQRNAMPAYKGGAGFRERIKSDSELISLLSEKEIDECFDIKYYLKNVNKIFRRVFGK